MFASRNQTTQSSNVNSRNSQCSTAPICEYKGALLTSSSYDRTYRITMIASWVEQVDFPKARSRIRSEKKIGNSSKVAWLGI